MARQKLVMANAEHAVAYQDLCALVSKHAAEVSSAEMLAIAANMVGKLIAMQDQRVVTADLAMEIVVKNLEQGNAEALTGIQNTAGSA